MADYMIATAPKRTSTKWQNRRVAWADFIERISTPQRTSETVTEYHHGMTKAERAEKKDVGGFVGGYLKNGQRKREYVAYRSLATLDADNIDKGVDLFARAKEAFPGTAFALYTTHSHTSDNPRWRVIMPFSETIEPEKYEAVCRLITQHIGIEYFDITTYDVERLMFWPSCPKDGEFSYEVHEGEPLDVDAMLAKEYDDWRDASAWPTGKNETEARLRVLKKLGDPREKHGIVGDFCRAYTISEAIAEFLPDVYSPVDGADDRYTFVNGSTVGGLKVYDNDLHAYSHHATDPVSGLDVNAFDLVRIHKFGMRDEESRENTPITKMPSYLAMTELMSKDAKVKNIRTKDIAAMFDDVPDDDTGYLNRLQMDAKGEKFKSNSDNFLLIMREDPRLKGFAGIDEFSHRILLKRDPPWPRSVKLKDGKTDTWQDSDDAMLRNYISQTYRGLTGRGLIDDAFTQVIKENRFHVVRDWWATLKWDGRKRVETILIDYLGAEESEYVRTVTTNFFMAAVMRVYHPGAKFDQCLVLTGPQGIGKSTVLDRMGGRWFSDNIATFQGKDTQEELQGRLIIELGEMQATKRAESDQAKAFISRRVERFRAPYGHRTEEYPRQCVFAATTNDDAFLKDRTGNRRFWIVKCRGNTEHHPAEYFTEDEAAHCWAELNVMYDGMRNWPVESIEKKMLLTGDVLKEAYEIQGAATEGEEVRDEIRHFLDILRPPDWEDKTIEERREFIRDADKYDDDAGREADIENGYAPRNETSAIEIWCECSGRKREEAKGFDIRMIRDAMIGIKEWAPYELSKSGKIKFRHYGIQRAFVRKVSVHESRTSKNDDFDNKKSPATNFEDLL